MVEFPENALWFAALASDHVWNSPSALPRACGLIPAMSTHPDSSGPHVSSDISYRSTNVALKRLIPDFNFIRSLDEAWHAQVMQRSIVLSELSQIYLLYPVLNTNSTLEWGLQ